MPKRIKQRIEINGEKRWVTGTTQQEVILAAAKMLAESGAVSGTSKANLERPLATAKDITRPICSSINKPKV